MDVDTLTPSDRFATRIEKAIATADVMLVLIGPTWVAQADRLAHPDDFIRREILAALRVECRLVPVCLDGAAVPDAATLPEELRPLVASEGAVLRHGEFVRDADHLADALAAFVRPSAEATRRGLSVALRPGRLAAVLVGGRGPPHVAAGGRWPSRRCPIALRLGAHRRRRLVAGPAGPAGRLHAAPGDRQRRQGDRRVPERHGHRRRRPHRRGCGRHAQQPRRAARQRDDHRFGRRVHDPVRGGRRHQPVAPRAGGHQAPLPEVSRDVRRQRPPLPAEPAPA